MVINRKIKIKEVKDKDSPLLCNLILTEEMDSELMKQGKAKGSITSIGLTRKEAEDAFKGLGKVLGKSIIEKIEKELTEEFKKNG